MQVSYKQEQIKKCFSEFYFFNQKVDYICNKFDKRPFFDNEH